MEKGLTYNEKNGHYYWQFVYINPKSGKKTRPHFVAKIKDENGNIRYAESEPEAILAKAQFITNGGIIDVNIIQKDEINIFELLESYKMYCRSIEKSYSKMYSYCMYFINFLADYYYNGNLEKAKDISIKQIETIDISNYRVKRQKDEVMVMYKDGKKSTGRKVKNSAINREVNSIRGMFTYAVKIFKKLKVNPYDGLEPLPIQEVIKTPLSDAQESIVINKSKQLDFTLYVMIKMFETFGNRKREVYDLLWDNVSLESNSIFKFGYVDFIKRKNGKSLRLPLSEDLRNCLNQLSKISEYVFTNPKTKTRYKDRKKAINTLLKEANAKKRGTGHHIFRASTATFSESNGATPSELRDLLGQIDVNSLDPYLNQGIKRLQEIINCNAARIVKNENK